MAHEPGAAPAAVHDHRLELRKEALTMALYVAICLLAALIAIPERAVEHTHALGVIWGITLGLAIAHWFAFRVSARMVGAGTIRPADVESAAAQLLGAAGVAVLASIGVVLASQSREIVVVEFLMAALISVIGFAVARTSGASTVRAVLYAVVVLAAAVAIALVKNLLVGH